MEQYIETISSQNWLSIFQAIATIWVAVLATYALGQWKKQIKLQKQVDFVDQLTDEIHEFMLATSPLISAIKFAKIGFESFANTNENYKHIKNNGVIAYIEAHGKKSSERMTGYIDPMRKIIGRIKSLSVKGQIYGIEGYDKAELSISVIEHVYRQMEVFAYFLRDADLNWEHPEVQKVLSSIAEMDEDLIETNITEQNLEYIKFVKCMYEKI